MFKFGAKKSVETSNKWIFGTMLVAAIAGLIAAFTLTVEKFHLLENPDAVLSCSFNVVLNCASVMKTWQSSVFGFPNSLIGLMGYSVVITVAAAVLSGVKFPKRFLQAAQICYGLGLIFAYWLFFQSVFVIQVLCPWCLVVTFVTTIIFETLLRYNLRENTFNFSKKTHKKISEFLKKDYDKVIVAGWIVLMIAIVFIKFGEGLFA
jgi:uncharacterized membrane protein